MSFAVALNSSIALPADLPTDSEMLAKLMPLMVSPFRWSAVGLQVELIRGGRSCEEGFASGLFCERFHVLHRPNSLQNMACTFDRFMASVDSPLALKGIAESIVGGAARLFGQAFEQGFQISPIIVSGKAFAKVGQLGNLRVRHDVPAVGVVREGCFREYQS